MSDTIVVAYPGDLSDLCPSGEFLTRGIEAPKVMVTEKDKDGNEVEKAMVPYRYQVHICLPPITEDMTVIEFGQAILDYFGIGSDMTPLDAAKLTVELAVRQKTYGMDAGKNSCKSILIENPDTYSHDEDYHESLHIAMQEAFSEQVKTAFTKVKSESNTAKAKLSQIEVVLRGWLAEGKITQEDFDKEIAKLKA